MIDLARVRRITGRSFAERDLVVLARDGFTLVVLADDLMAYVPADEARAARLAAERRVLARVAARVSFALPRPVGPIETDVDLRVPARGVTGSAYHDRLTSDPGLALRAADWMGRALAELHGSLTATELDALAVPRTTWPLPRAELVRNVDDLLDGGLRDAAHRVLDRWDARTGERDVFVHGDFGTHNLAFDEATGMPVGLFDFHDAGRGPRAVDFALLPSLGSLGSLGEAVLVRALAAYGDDAPPLADVRLAHAVGAIAYLKTKSSSVAWVKTAVSDAGFSIR